MSNTHYNAKSEVTSAVATYQTTYNYGFLFDPIGNRVTSSSTETGSSVTRNYTSNLLNQYTAIDNPTASPTYDDDGNMLNDGTWTFTWNAENRIITATQGTTVIDYKYDYFGRRVERKVTEDQTVTSQTRYVYEQGSFNKIEELNALDSNAITKKYVWGLDIAGSQKATGSVGALLAQIDGIGTAYSTFDANGNVSEYLDTSGVVQGHFDYSPFGKVTVENGVRPDDFNFRFSTKYEDALTGDLDYGYRDYDSKLGRWRARDPVNERGFYTGGETWNNWMKMTAISRAIQNVRDALLKYSDKATVSASILVLDKLELALINNFNTAKYPNIYCFVSNNPINTIDVLGLDDRLTCIGKCVHANRLDLTALIPIPWADLYKEWLAQRVVNPDQPGTTMFSTFLHWLITGPFKNNPQIISALKQLRYLGRYASKIATPLTLAEGGYSIVMEAACCIICCKDPNSYSGYEVPGWGILE